MSLLHAAMQTVLRSPLEPILGARHSFAANDPVMALFANNEQGGYYDVQDLSTMYQDSIGTTPAVVNQPVGLHLDKRKGLVRGSERVTNGTFDTNIAGWANVGSNPASSVTWVAPGAMRLYNPDSAGTLVATHEAGLVVGRWYEAKFTLSNFVSGTIQFQSGTTILLASVAGTYRAFFRAGASTISFVRGFAVDVRVDDISVKEVDGNHRFQNTTASKPILRQNANGHYYLQYDGFDDFLQTASIDFTGTDELTVWSGVLKLSDAAIGCVLETSGVSNTNAGTFAIFAPISAGADNLTFQANGGTARGAIASGFPAPAPIVVTGSADISADLVTTRVNGSQAAQNTSDLGASASFASNQPLYTGRRGGSTNPFNGYEYGLIIRGAVTPLATVQQVENLLNGFTEAY